MDGDGTTGDGITGDGVVTRTEPMALIIHDGAIITGIHWPPIRCVAEAALTTVRPVCGITVVDLTSPAADLIAEVV